MKFTRSVGGATKKRESERERDRQTQGSVALYLWHHVTFNETGGRAGQTLLISLGPAPLGPTQ